MIKKTLLSIIASAMLLISCNSGKTEKTEQPVAQTETVDLNKAIDMEHHFYAMDFIDYTKSRTEYPYWKDGAGICYNENSIMILDIPNMFCTTKATQGLKVTDIITDMDEIRLGELDYAGVSTACLSSSDGVERLSREDAIRLARATNDAAAEAMKRHPGRFIGTICLPTLYVEDAIVELERAVNELGLKYWHTHSSYGEHHLYEEQFEPLFAKCAELGVAFYLHPAYPSDTYFNDSGLVFNAAGFGFGVDVMKTAIRLVMSGLFDRYPNLVMIIGHMGEFFPYCLDRLDNRFGKGRDWGLDPCIKYKHSFKYYFENKNIMMTTSGIFDPEVVLFAMKTIGVDNIMLGTDFPFEGFKTAVDFVKNLPISDEDKAKILYKNAETYILKQKVTQ